jgi:holo-[acyl-carrier protein] synthase
VDLVEVERVRAAVARWGDRFVRRVFTDGEVADARRGGDFAASLAARFAAKEAAYKAARALVGRPIALRSIVVSAGRGRPPRVALEGASGAGNLVWWCSLTHGGGLACAVVVAESARGEDGAP